MARIHLIRDVLDKRVIARQDMPIGRVDGIVLEVREGTAPRVIFLELGAMTLAARLSDGLGRWVGGLKQRLGVGEGQPVRLPFEKMRSGGLDVKVDMDAEDSGALEWETWLCDRVVRHIPGSGL